MRPDIERVLMGLDSLHLRGLGPHGRLNPVVHLQAQEPHLPEDAPVARSGGGFFFLLRRVFRGHAHAAIKS
ncbi:MAG: hypothetical protein AAFY59_17155 [Pseudomonadota bacterium]